MGDKVATPMGAGAPSMIPDRARDMVKSSAEKAELAWDLKDEQVPCWEPCF